VAGSERDARTVQNDHLGAAMFEIVQGGPASLFCEATGKEPVSTQTNYRSLMLLALTRNVFASWASPLVCLSLSLFAGQAAAHHSAAMYDGKKIVTVVGTVTKFEWANPHVYIYLHQSAEPNQPIEWEVECSPPSILGRLGWTAASIHIGQVITVVGSPAREPGRHVLLPNLIKRTDAVLFERKTELAQLASTGSAPPAGTKVMGLDGVWATQLSLKLEKLLDGDNLPLSKQGKIAYKHFDEKTMHPGTACVPTPAPFLMVTPDLKRISKANGAIVIDGEFDNAQRIIHMDLSSHEGAVPSIQGHSIGHWEGASLLIDTALFAPHAMGNGYGVPSGAAKHLTERLTPSTDGTTVTYHFEVTDPEFLSRTVQGDIQWEYRPNLTYAPPKCDPENARRSFRRD
jgi:Family of unknown function (DUF6152)